MNRHYSLAEDFATTEVNSELTPADIIAEQEAQHRRELRKLDDIAFSFLNAAGGDPVQAEKLLDDAIDLLFEGGVLQLWRYRIVLAAVRGGFMTEAGDLFERVRAIPVESVIREYFPSLELNHSGRDLVTKCPFHAEKTASFKIDAEKNRWHCFGECATGGSTIDLLLMGELASDPLAAAKRSRGSSVSRLRSPSERPSR